MTVAYVDASAAVKLVVAEPQSPALLRELDTFDDRASSGLLVAEVLRAVTLWGAANGLDTEALRQHASTVLDGLWFVDADAELVASASGLSHPGLTVLGGLHLASAMQLGRDLGAMFTYDESVAAAARAAGLEVRAPG